MTIDTLAQLEGFANHIKKVIYEIPENLTFQISARGNETLIQEILKQRGKTSKEELDSKIYFMTKVGIRFKIKFY